MPYARFNDVNLYYELHGQGEPFLRSSSEARELVVSQRRKKLLVMASSQSWPMAGPTPRGRSCSGRM